MDRDINMKMICGFAAILLLVGVMGFLDSCNRVDDSDEYSNNVMLLVKEAEYTGCIMGCTKVYEKLNYTGLNITEMEGPYFLLKEECDRVC